MPYPDRLQVNVQELRIGIRRGLKNRGKTGFFERQTNRKKMKICLTDDKFIL